MIAMKTLIEPIPRVASRLQIAILAAGFSSRLGRPKALARIHGMSLLRRTLAVVARVTGAPVIVVVPPQKVRYRTEARGFNVVFAVNPRRAGGLSTSVQCSISRVRHASALLLLPVDLATLQPRDLDRLISRWRGSARRVIARRIGQCGASPQGGVPLILPHWLYAHALDVAGDIGLRELVNRLPAEHRVLVDLPSAAVDIDTPQDLQAARRRLRHTSFTI
jgi:molybdenum cofactor cytidylyltransferase